MMINQTISDIHFNADFDSGNLEYVVSKELVKYSNKNFDNAEYSYLKKNDRIFYLKTRNDAKGEIHESSSRSWFHFSIKNNLSSKELNVTLHLADLNKHLKLYQQGLRPVIRSSGTVFKPHGDFCPVNFNEKGWKRWKGKFPLAYGNTEDDGFCISINLTLQPGIYYYLAYCYPWSYQSSIKFCTLLENSYLAKSGLGQYFLDGSSGEINQSNLIDLPDNLFLRVEDFCQSYQGRTCRGLGSSPPP